ncbi:MAG: four helix bundle protein [Fibrobacter sp.]|nr:four helix bundle protein [Fibrobacter sp.]
MGKNVLKEKSFAFAIRIVNLYKYLSEQRCEYILSKQILRSGTSIGANFVEGSYAQTRRDFHAKLSISKKEAGETKYWLEVLRATDYIDEEQFKSLSKDCEELIRLLFVICKKTERRDQLTKIPMGYYGD